MFRPFTKSAYLGAVALASLSCLPAHATELCETRLRTQCTADCYVYMALIPDAACDEQNAFVITTAHAATAPADPALKCSRDASGYQCEAWPQGEEISYVWLSEQASTATINALNPHQYFNCGAGEVSVAVIGPSGAASIATATLPACN